MRDLQVYWRMKAGKMTIEVMDIMKSNYKKLYFWMDEGIQEKLNITLGWLVFIVHLNSESI